MGTARHSGFIDRFLAAYESVKPEDARQFGVKGMRWGVRKDPGAGPGPASEVGVKTTPGKKVKTTGGEKRPASEDAIKAAVGRQIAKKSTTDALSNEELRVVIERMQLEANYTRLNQQNVSAGRAFINKMIGKNPKETQANVKAASQIREEILKVKDDHNSRKSA